jgi:chorismate mutase/prephenate dehydratase
MTLEELRCSIDEVDRQILRLLNERAKFVAQVGEEKRKNNEEAYAPGRERQILQAIQEANAGPLSKAAVKNIFSEIISACRSMEKTTRVAFLGPLGTFSHIAARNCFGSSAEFLPQPGFQDVIAETEKGNADYGVLPIENSTEGPLGEPLDLLVQSSLSIYGETYVQVHHCLLSHTPLGEIEKVYSLPTVFRQCHGWLRNNLPKVELLEAGSTASAAERAAKEPGSAAVATAICAELYNLDLIAENIEDLSHNRTRFAILGNRRTAPTGRDKTSLLFSTKHEPGTLHRALEVFERARLNLTMIQSRPNRRTPWEYIFFLDFTGHQEEERVKKALSELKGVTTYLKILGSYAEGE